MQICTGYGECFTQDNCLNCVKNSDVICKYNCVLIECPNYIMCGAKEPKWYLNCHGGLCYSCNLMFGKWQGGKGKLDFVDACECCICFDTTLCVSQPKCSHYACIECFKRCYHGNESSIIEPKFPYGDDIADEYFDTFDKTKWENDELIKKYEDDFDEYEYKKSVEYEQEKNLRRCPLCRK